MALNTKDLPVTWARSAKREFKFKHIHTTWGVIFDALTNPEKARRLPLTSDEYRDASDQVRADCKNGPCWLGAEMIDDGPHKRKSAFMKHRTILSLDLDKTGLDERELGFELARLFIDLEYLVHPSASSMPDNVSARLVFPLARPVSLDTYEALARYFAQDITELFGDSMDWTSVQAGRLMYLPTLPSDAPHWFIHNAGAPCDSAIDSWEVHDTGANNELLDAPCVDYKAGWLDPLRRLGHIEGWHDRDSWPTGATEDEEAVRSTATMRQDPREFSGLHGAVCRVYSVEDVLPETGKWTKSVEADRWSLIGATTANGGQVFDDGLFFYSHHNSDPHGGRLLDAYEIILAHKLDGMTGQVEADNAAYAAAYGMFEGDEQVAEELRQSERDELALITEGFVQRERPLKAALASAKMEGSEGDQDKPPSLPTSATRQGTEQPTSTTKAETDNNTVPEKENVVENFEYPATCSAMLERYAFLEHGGAGLKVFDMKRGKAVSLPPGIHSHHSYIEYGPKGGTITVYELDLWKEHPDRMTCQHLVWNPQKPMLYRDDDGYLCCNEYAPVHHDSTGYREDDLQTLIDHVNWLLPIERERKWMWQWMAHLVQLPGVRIGIVPLLIAKTQGSGRGALSLIMRGVLGADSITTPRIDDVLNSRFNSFLFDCQLTIIDEVYTADVHKYSLQERINAMVTDTHLRFEAKGVDAVDKQCFTNLLMLSNKEDALRLSHEDRRVQVLTNPDKPARWADGLEASIAYYDRLYEAINGCDRSEMPSPESEHRSKAVMAKFYEHLMSIDLSDFERGRAWSDQDAKKRMASFGNSVTENALADLCAAPPSIAMSYSQIREWCSAEVIGQGMAKSVLDPINAGELLRLVTKSTQYLVPVGESKHRLGVGGSPQRLYAFNKDEPPSIDMAKAAARRYEENLVEGEGFQTREKPAEASVTPIKKD